VQKSIAIAIPVLLGSLGRIPLGILADRFGGRIVFSLVMLFSIIQTFADFQLVYVLTGGGPANATQLFATYAYQIGVGTGLLSQGAAISLAMFPFLLIVVVVQLLYIRRVEVH